jgi:hypothetical protein
MGESIEFLDLGTDDPAVIGLAVHGRLTGEDMAVLIERLNAIRGSGHKARLYLNLAEYTGYELPVVREKLSHMGTLWGGIERCAYVVDKAWLSTMIGLVDAVTPMHLRAFGLDQDAEARDWVRSPD